MKKQGWIESVMSAVTFAEANEHRTALEFVKEGSERTADARRPVRSTFRGDVAVRPAGGR